MQSRTTQQSHFIYILAGLCCFYLGFEIFYNYYAMLSVDEFWFAHNVYAFKDQLPYRDFAPYKTVLGYYLLLLPLLAKQGVIAPLIFVKNVLAVLNTAILLSTSLWLTRYFSRVCILASLAIIVTSEIVLSYSTNLRVDMLGYWFGFFAFIMLIENRFISAGILMGLAFATTQKLIWYIAASNGALGLYWLLYERSTLSMRNLVAYNAVIALMVAGYVALWSSIADWQTVINSVFYEASTMYKLDWYDSARMLFWQALTLNNPLLILLWPLTLVSLCVSYHGDDAQKPRFLIVSFSTIIFMCLIPYKQIFPYYLQVAIPILFLLYAAFFSWICGIFANADSLKLIINKNAICLFLGLYIACVMWVTVRFSLPQPYLMMCMVPLLLGAYLLNYDNLTSSMRGLLLNMVCIAIIVVNGIFPLMLFCIKMVDINGSYQKQNLAVMDSLLSDGSDYLAGIEMIYYKTQPIAGMRHLMGPAIDFLQRPTEKLRAVMLASLNEDPNATTDSVIAALKASNVKFYVNNYRMMEVPQKIKSFLDQDYEHFWGSLYLYAPLVEKSQHQFNIRFAGSYQIETNKSQMVMINGKSYTSNSVLSLTKGSHTSSARQSYRLKLIPGDLPSHDIHYQTDRWEKMLL